MWIRTKLFLEILAMLIIGPLPVWVGFNWSLWAMQNPIYGYERLSHVIIATAVTLTLIAIVVMVNGVVENCRRLWEFRGLSVREMLLARS